MLTNDTIAAIVTAPGEAAVGIIRLSGDEAIAIADKFFKGKQPLSTAPTHSINYGKIIEQNGNCIDEVLAMLMRAPKSFTGEDVVEIQAHGGTLVLEKILNLLLSGGARLADNGEYSKRAFLNGKMDLSEAESIMDIVNANNDQALDIALNQRFGGLRREIGALRADLVELVAFMQADIDYPEDDIERLTIDEYRARVHDLQTKLQALAQGYAQGRIYREGLKVVLAGKPNVGKSSLLNALLNEERAIVTPIAGTTRDTICEYLNLRGIPLKIIDTAGIRETNDEIEKIGVERSRKSLQEADLVLYLLEKGTELDLEDRANLALIGNKPLIFVQNKSDLSAQATASLPADSVEISALTGEGLEELAQKIKAKFIGGEIDFTSHAVLSNVRHFQAVNQALNDLTNFQENLQMNLPFDFLVIDLQHAWEVLGTISGETVEEDLLDIIFSKFCLGK